MKTIIDSVPILVTASVVAFVLLVIVAWLLSIVGGFKSDKGKGLRLFLIVPLTNPFATIVLFFRERKAASTAIVCYIAALVIVPAGGLIAKKIERAEFEGYQAHLASKGISIDYKDLIPVAETDEKNIWKHPFLEPMGEAGQDTEAGALARETIQSGSESYQYHVLTNPKPPKGLKYASDPESNPLLSTSRNGNPLRSLHESALSILETRDGEITEDNLPKNWQDNAKLIADHYRSAEDATRQLQEAINRPNDHYPYQWEKNFGMLLPHLANLRAFSRATSLRGKAAAIMGDASETFKMIDLTLKLAETGDSDLLISRLVQFSQYLITLESIRIAQQFHVGSDEQWAALFAQLDRIDLPEKISAALNAERALGNGAMLPMAEASVFDMASKINQLETISAIPDKPSSSLEVGLRAVTGVLWGSAAQAMVIHNWTKALQAYEIMIENIETTYTASRSKPWNQCEVPSLEKKIDAYGVFAKLLLPAIDSVFIKAIEAQHQIEIAKLAIVLERYYIAHQTYPETLALLAPTFLSAEPIDPMTGQPWQYQRLETKGFFLYSLGRDGEDDNGQFKNKVRGDSSNEQSDDRGWYVSPTTPELPDFSFTHPTNSP